MDAESGSPQALWQAATDGRFRLDEGAARECAAHFDWFVGMLSERIEEVKRLDRIEGFGGFESAQQLRKGFEGKSLKAIEALTASTDAALRMKASVLRAGGLLEDADAANAAAIAATSEDIE